MEFVLEEELMSDELENSKNNEGLLIGEALEEWKLDMRQQLERLEGKEKRVHPTKKTDFLRLLDAVEFRLDMRVGVNVAERKETESFLKEARAILCFDPAKDTKQKVETEIDKAKPES